jgi:MFS family permease
VHADAVATPITGRLGDLYGRRRMLLVCTVPLIAGSLVCALASSVVPMIAGRRKTTVPLPDAVDLQPAAARA